MRKSTSTAVSLLQASGYMYKCTSSKKRADQILGVRWCEAIGEAPATSKSSASKASVSKAASSKATSSKAASKSPAAAPAKFSHGEQVVVHFNIFNCLSCGILWQDHRSPHLTFLLPSHLLSPLPPSSHRLPHTHTCPASPLSLRLATK